MEYNKVIDFDDGSEQYRVKTFKETTINSYWEKWLIFKPKRSKDWQIELRKHLPPYFDANVNKINEFSMRENIFYPPCPQEFLEHLINGIALRKSLGLYKSKYFYFKELQQLLIEYLKLFYFRMDAIIDIFQTNTKLDVSKEKYPKIVVKCSNCRMAVFINVHCPHCQNEFYCDEVCQRIHYEKHRKECAGALTQLPPIVEPLRVEVHLNSQNFGEEIEIYNEHQMTFSKMMKGKVLLMFLYKTLRKDRWFRNNNYICEDKIDKGFIVIKRETEAKMDVDVDGSRENSEVRTEREREANGKDFIIKMNPDLNDKYKDDEYKDMLKLSVLQELKLQFYKLGALLNDVLSEQHASYYKFIIIFAFP